MRQLAHELNSLLDGAARCVRQASRQLTSPSQTDSAATESTGLIDRKLSAAMTAMQKMSEVLERVMHADAMDRSLLDSTQTLGEFVPELIDRLQAGLSEHLVSINLHMTNEAASIRTGQLGTVLMNGLTNAINACISSPNLPRVIEASLTCNNLAELVILITDTGPGVVERDNPLAAACQPLKPGGHGIGLDLCRAVVDELGGRLQLMNIPFGAGAVFHARIPLLGLKAA